MSDAYYPADDIGMMAAGQAALDRERASKPAGPFPERVLTATRARRTGSSSRSTTGPRARWRPRAPTTARKREPATSTARARATTRAGPYQASRTLTFTALLSSAWRRARRKLAQSCENRSQAFIGERWMPGTFHVPLACTP